MITNDNMKMIRNISIRAIDLHFGQNRLTFEFQKFQCVIVHIKTYWKSNHIRQ